MRRDYRTVCALDGVSFSLEPGELVGYIGPNGAGKSTTVKLLSGILVPDSGRCEVLGRVPWKDRVAHVRQIGVVFGQRTQLWWDLPVIESFELLRDIYKVPQTDYVRRLDELVGLLDLARLLDVPVRQLSLGQRMRCDLTATLLHAPPLLFLDEPTIGLDAVSKLAVRDFIKQINRDRGTTVILTTHNMDDIEALCTRVIVISQGQILSDGSLTELRARVSTERRLIVDLVEEAPGIDDPDAEVIQRSGHRVHLRFDPDRGHPRRRLPVLRRRDPPGHASLLDDRGIGNHEHADLRRGGNRPVSPLHLPHLVPAVLHLCRAPGLRQLLPGPGHPGEDRPAGFAERLPVARAAHRPPLPLSVPARMENRRAPLPLYGELNALASALFAVAVKQRRPAGERTCHGSDGLLRSGRITVGAALRPSR